MQTSIFIARLIGPLIAVMGLSMLIHHKAFHKLAHDVLDNPGAIIMIGMMTLFAGLSLVLTHNLWSKDWPVTITLIGWLNIAAGLIRIFLPGFVQKMGHILLTKRVTLFIAAPIWFGFGLWLSYHGYGA